MGLVTTPCLAINGYYFSTKYVIANSISSVGIGLGTIAFPPLLELLIDLYSWQGAALIEAALCLHCTLFGALFQPMKMTPCVTSSSSPSSSSHNGVDGDKSNGYHHIISTSLDLGPDTTELIPLRKPNNPSCMRSLRDRLRRVRRMVSTTMGAHWQLFRDAPLLLLLGFVAMFYMVAYFNYLIFFAKIAIDHCITTDSAATLLAISGTASSITRVANWPLITLTNNPQLVFFVSNTLLSIPFLAFPWLSSKTTFLLAGVSIGVSIGTVIPVANIVAKTIVTSTDRHALVIGWLYLFQGVGQIVLGYLGGK